MNYYKIYFSGMVMAIISLLLAVSCKKEESLKISGEVAETVDAYLRQLSFDPDAILNVQGNGSLEPVKKTTDGERKVNGTNVCIDRLVDLSRNFDEVAILRPNQSIIWPGALCKVNDALFSGLPEPITLKRAPVKLSIDLPNIGEAGNLNINEPSERNVRAALDEALDWWNNNAYVDGYVNPANITHQSTTAYSKNQLGMELGLNIQWAGGALSSELSHISTEENYVTMMSFKQGFYTVSMETPERPACVFGNGVTLADVQSQIKDDNPAAYVQSVTYGRILFFRMETNKKHKQTDVEAALQWATGTGFFDTKLKTTYESILATSKVSLVIIGGNPDGSAKALDVDGTIGFKSLARFIEDYATYRKDNPGVPIGYTMRSLSDNSLLKMGFQTNFQYLDCAPIPSTRIYYKNNGLYLTKLRLEYTLRGKREAKDSGDMVKGKEWINTLPEGAHQIELSASYRDVFTWKGIFHHYIEAGDNRCYSTWGSTLDVRSCFIRGYCTQIQDNCSN